MTQLARNALNNLAGAVLPALVMFVTVPILIRGLGDAQYGMFVLLTSITGYLAVLDLNITASSIRYLAAADARRESAQISAVVSFGAFFYLAIGSVGALALVAFAGPLVKWLVDPQLYPWDQAELVLRVTALGFLLGQLYAFLLSLPQGLQRYDLSARVEMISGTLVPLATAGIVFLGAGLLGVAWLRNIAAALTIGGLVLIIRRLMPSLSWSWPSAPLRREMLAFSGYAYLNRLASLSYQHSDKLVIAAVLDVKQVALYTVPVLLANRVMGMTYRLTQVIFPASSALLAAGRNDEVLRLMLLSMRLVTSLNAFVLVLLFVGGAWFLEAWLGRSYAQAGAAILLLVSMGALLDSLTNAPALVTDGAGRPRVTGGFAVCRAIVGLLALYFGAKWFGIVGVAASHLLTSLVFTVAFLSYFRRHVLAVSVHRLVTQAVAPGLLVMLCGGLAGKGVLHSLAPTHAAQLTALAVAAFVMTCLFWFVVLPVELRQRLRARLGVAV